MGLRDTPARSRGLGGGREAEATRVRHNSDVIGRGRVGGCDRSCDQVLFV